MCRSLLLIHSVIFFFSLAYLICYSCVLRMHARICMFCWNFALFRKGKSHIYADYDESALRMSFSTNGKMYSLYMCMCVSFHFFFLMALKSLFSFFFSVFSDLVLNARFCCVALTKLDGRKFIVHTNSL